MGAGRPPASATRARGGRARASSGTASPPPSGAPPSSASCSRPGTVSSPLRVPPPIVASASSTVTSTPAAGERDRAGEPVRARADDDRFAHAVSRRRRAGAGAVSPRPGKSHDSSSHGRALDHVGDVDPALLDQAVGGVVDPVALALDVRRLGLERDDPHLARLEVAALLDRLEQLARRGSARRRSSSR